MHISRKLAAQQGREAVRIIEAGRYQTESGKVVEIGEQLRRAVEGTCSYPPHQHLPTNRIGDRETRIEVENATTLAAARRLVAAEERPMALNFASAKHPGGGFLSGALAQEESLARSSGLVACLAGNAMYDFHRAAADPMYTNYVLYSPDVPVFRDDDGTLLEEPYLCSFITAPAVNAKVVLARGSSRRQEIRDAMWERVLKVLAVAAAHGHEALVLGAWGCGVFGNDSGEIAELFRHALAERFRGMFGRVVFVVLDWSEDARFIGPFRTIFGAPARQREFPFTRLPGSE
jgi:uncharacterized protein (TIGR02452 family)